MNQAPLHKLMPPIEESMPHAEAAFDRASVQSGPIVAHFGDVTGPAIGFIEESAVILGCVAWLTSFQILDALATVENVAIVVQKEDFLRPDLGAKGGWKNDLRVRYERLSCDIYRQSLPAPLSSMSYCSDPAVPAVRCAGHHNSDKALAMPRMHHKFLVRCERRDDGETLSPDNYRPTAVWTGSFNFSYNAGQSFENAVEIHDETIAEAYLQEFARVAAISEPLDWTSTWAAPEWRIGS